jgi:hypothetical protein
VKYWRGYLAAAIFAAVAWGFVSFAEAHPVLVDMIYPYLTRIYISSAADWAGGTTACIWQILLFLGIVAIIASIVLMIVFKWNFVQWLGWVLAFVFGVNMLTTVSYHLNAYTSPLADDIRMNVSDYTVSELNEATLFFRDQANILSGTVRRNNEGAPVITDFNALAAVAHQGFDVLTYDKAMSVFASSKAPVKQLSMTGLFLSKGDSGMTVALTGESAVNPKVPSAAMPFAICKEMSHRISIYAEADANFAAYLACVNNPDPLYQYSGYLMAYYYCYQAMLSIPTSAAQASASKAEKGLNGLVRDDIEAVYGFYGEAESTANVQSTANITDSEGENTLIAFSSYSDVADLFASWYIQEFILPVMEEEEASKTPEFDPYDEVQVGIGG